MTMIHDLFSHSQYNSSLMTSLYFNECQRTPKPQPLNQCQPQPQPLNQCQPQPPNECQPPKRILITKGLRLDIDYYILHKHN